MMIDEMSQTESQMSHTFRPVLSVLCTMSPQHFDKYFVCTVQQAKRCEADKLALAIQISCTVTFS